MGQNSSAILNVFCYTNPWRQLLILKALKKFYIKNILQSGRIMIGTFVFRVFFQYNGFWYSFNLSHIECFCEMAHDIAITQKMEIVEQIAEESKPHRTRKVWNKIFSFSFLLFDTFKVLPCGNFAENEGVLNPHFVTKDLYSLVHN